MPSVELSALPTDSDPHTNGAEEINAGGNGSVAHAKLLPGANGSPPSATMEATAQTPQQTSTESAGSLAGGLETSKTGETAIVSGQVEAKPTTTGDAAAHLESNGVVGGEVKAEGADAAGTPPSASVTSGSGVAAAPAHVKAPASPPAVAEALEATQPDANAATAVDPALRETNSSPDPVASYEAGATTGVPPAAGDGSVSSPAAPLPPAPEPPAPAEPGAAIPPASAAPGAQALPVKSQAGSPGAEATGDDASGSHAAKRQRKSTTHFAEPGVTSTQLAPAYLVGMTAAQIKYAQAAIKTLMKRPEAFAFNEPVDPIAAGIPTYLDVIKKPIDFRTIDHKLNFSSAALHRRPNDKLIAGAKVGLTPSKDVYANAQEWVDDVRRIFANCRTFNGPEHPISQAGDTLENLFNGQLPKLPAAEPPPPSPTAATASSSKARRPSNAAPAARRSSVDDGTGRPKREVHAPSRELPWQDEPNTGGSTGTRKRRSTGTAREEAYWAKVNADELRHCTKVITELLSQPTIQAYAWVFNELPAKDLDFAPAYYKMIKRPISLFMVSDRVKAKEYESKSEFEADMNQIFKNCYTFNAPGHDVYVFGQRLEDAYKEKMARMPKHKELSPENDDDVDAEADEDEEEEEEEEDLDEKALRAKIAALEAKLHKSTSNKSSKSASAGGAAAKGKKRTAADITGGAAPTGTASKKKAPAKKAAAAQPMTAVEALPAAAKKAKAAPKKKAPAATATSSKKSNGVEEEVRTVTYEQKEELAAKITQLPDDRLDGALKIIAEDKPQSSTDDEEIELDIDDLSPRTLYRLYRYVVRPKHKKAAKSSAVDGRKRGTGGVKRKNLDEDEEADRIARLQAQLSQFDNPDAAASAPTSAGHAGAHDDHVHSESSDEGSESESESDY